MIDSMTFSSGIKRQQSDGDEVSRIPHKVNAADSDHVEEVLERKNE
jgi:hypothetical protein